MVPYPIVVRLRSWLERLCYSTLERSSVDHGLMSKSRTVWLGPQVAGADSLPYNAARCLHSWLKRLGCSMLEQSSVDYGAPRG